MGSRSNRREESQSKGRFTRRKEFKLTGGKGTLRRDLIERGGSSEAWYGGGGRDRTASVAGSALNPASPAPTEGASPLVCPPRRGHTPFASPGPRSDPLKERSCSRGISIEACWLASRSVSEGWWRWAGSNRRPAAYESAALPTELHRHAHGMYQGPSSTSRVLSTDGRAMTQARGRHNPSISPGS